jgi:hypothetical protein
LPAISRSRYHPESSFQFPLTGQNLSSDSSLLCLAGLRRGAGREPATSRLPAASPRPMPQPPQVMFPLPDGGMAYRSGRVGISPCDNWPHRRRTCRDRRENPRLRDVGACLGHARMLRVKRELPARRADGERHAAEACSMQALDWASAGSAILGTAYCNGSGRAVARMRQERGCASTPFLSQ